MSLTRRAALGTLAALAGSGPLHAAAFPARPVRIVVPYAVGVGPDVVARSVAEQLAQAWSQPVLVDNKPGASGIVAFAELRTVAPDGHTLFLADTATLAVNPLLHANLPYHPVRDIAPLSLLFRATFVLWTGARGRHADLRALLEAARREPGRVSYASLGHGHASHVALESFARAADVRLLHVPFKDAGALMGALVAGEVDTTAFGVNTVAGLFQAGRLRPLAVAARERLREQPDIPTLPEAGGPPVEMHPWAALVAPAATPAPLLERLQHDLFAALDSTEVRARAAQAGFEITPSTPLAVRERVAADDALYRPLVAEGRIAPL